MRMRLVLPLLMLSGISIALAEPLATQADEVLIVRNHHDQRFWKEGSPAKKLKQPVYPKDLALAGVSGCVAIGFYIEPDGSTSNYRVLLSHIGDSRSGKIGKKDKRAIISMFGNATVKSLEGIKFEPGTENPDKQRGFSYTYVSFSTEQLPLQGTCEIPDLEVFLGNKISSAASK
ncbi:MAG: energy transducer TonB [Arenimonas sp.]